MERWEEDACYPSLHPVVPQKCHRNPGWTRVYNEPLCVVGLTDASRQSSNHTLGSTCPTQHGKWHPISQGVTDLRLSQWIALYRKEKSILNLTLFQNKFYSVAFTHRMEFQKTNSEIKHWPPINFFWSLVEELGHFSARKIVIPGSALKDHWWTQGTIVVPGI